MHDGILVALPESTVQELVIIMTAFKKCSVLYISNQARTEYVNYAARESRQNNESMKSDRIADAKAISMRTRV
jgi:hypothetical protein